MLALSQVFNLLRVEKERSEDANHKIRFQEVVDFTVCNTVFGIGRINLLFQVAADSMLQTIRTEPSCASFSHCNLTHLAKVACFNVLCGR